MQFSLCDSDSEPNNFLISNSASQQLNAGKQDSLENGNLQSTPKERDIPYWNKYADIRLTGPL